MGAGRAFDSLTDSSVLSRPRSRARDWRQGARALQQTTTDTSASSSHSTSGDCGHSSEPTQCSPPPSRSPATRRSNTLVVYVDGASGESSPLPTEEEIVFDGTLFIPPVGTANHRIDGELGRHALDSGNGILLHGTPHKESIGTAATHGCIRLDDDAILWLHEEDTCHV